MFEFIAWVLCSIGASMVAHKKGRDWFNWLFVGIFLGPLAFLFALIASEKRGVLDRRAVKAGRKKKCPYCAEIIKTEAKVCRYCNRELET